MKKIYVDFDGVVLDMCEGIKQYLKKSHINFKPENVVKYNFDGDIGCCKDMIYASIKQPEMYDYIPVKGNSKESMKKLLRFAEVIPYTGAVDKKEIWEGRTQVIKDFGLEGEPLPTPKPVFADGFAVVDDCIDVLKDWHEQNPDALLLLIDAPYNQQANNEPSSSLWDYIIRCDSFDACVELLIDAYL